MRYLFAVAVAGLIWAPVAASDVEVKGPHICCGQCVKIAKGILAKVEGVTDANADQKSKTVTFKATDEKAAKAGVKALFDGGFFGAATNDGKELKVAAAAVKKGDKAASVTVKDVHVCCGQCKKGIKEIFNDAKISYEGSGPQLTVTIEGDDLYPGTVLEALRKAGFNGKLK
jgi:copper chaperone CopZ